MKRNHVYLCALAFVLGSNAAVAAQSDSIFGWQVKSAVAVVEASTEEVVVTDDAVTEKIVEESGAVEDIATESPALVEVEDVSKTSEPASDATSAVEGMLATDGAGENVAESAATAADEALAHDDNATTVAADETAMEAAEEVASKGDEVADAAGEELAVTGSEDGEIVDEAAHAEDVVSNESVAVIEEAATHESMAVADTVETETAGSIQKSDAIGASEEEVVITEVSAVVDVAEEEINREAEGIVADDTTSTVATPVVVDLITGKDAELDVEAASPEVIASDEVDQ